MDFDLEIFERRLRSEWLPAFCNDVKRKFSSEGFVEKSLRIAGFDATNFIRALDSGVVTDFGGGRYRCHRSNAFEQIFWEGRKANVPRPLTLWLEPVITIGTMARLHLDYGWPVEALCMQSKSWAFDFAVFKQPSASEFIAGEVKKSARELDALMAHMIEFGRLGSDNCDGSAPRKNALKKSQALQLCKAPYFWAVGPDNYTRRFSVAYHDDDTAEFTQVSLEALINDEMRDGELDAIQFPPSRFR